MTRNRLLALVVCLVIGLAAVGFWQSGLKSAPQPLQPTVMPVVLAEVVPAPGTNEVRATGKLRAVHESKLAFKIGGLIRAIHADVGDRVKKGQVLAELDLKEINSQASQGQAGLAKAQRDLDRARMLVKSGAAPAQRVDDAKTAYDVARAALDATTFNQELARITASDDGIILARTAEAGEIIAPGVPILALGDLSENFLVRAGFADRDIARISVGDKAQVTLVAKPDTALAAQVTRIAGMADARTGTFDVEVTLIDHPQGLASGMVGNVVITLSKSDSPALIPAVPISAVLEGHGDSAFVFVHNPADGTVARRRITLGSVTGALIAAPSGVRLGEQVVTLGAAYLRDGDRVSPTPKETPDRDSHK